MARIDLNDQKQVRALNRAAENFSEVPTSPVRFVDRVVGFINPRKGAERVRDRYLALHIERSLKDIEVRAAYKSADKNRLNAGWKSDSLDINAHLKADLTTIRNRSRSLLRNNPHAAQAINAFTNYVIGVGFELQMQVQKMGENSKGEPILVPMELWNNYVEDTFNDWAEDVNIQSSESCPDHFKDAQGLWFRKLFEDGEVFVHRAIDMSHPVVPMTLEFIEPEALNTSLTKNAATGNPIIMGVEVEAGSLRPVAYWVYACRTPSNYYCKDNKSLRIPAKNMSHSFMKLRPRQTRGLPWMFAVEQNFYDLDEYTEAELIGNKIAACLSVFFMGASSVGNAGLDNPNGASATDGDGNVITDLQPGMIGYLPRASDMKVVSPQKPGATFKPFTRYIQQKIFGGIYGGISYTGATRDTEGVTFASGRMSQQADYQVYRAIQKVVGRKFCSWTVFRPWMDLAVLNGVVTAPGYFDKTPGKRFWQRHEWMPGGWNWGINPLQEVNASITSMRAGITTLDDECANLGHDARSQLIKKSRIDRLAEDLGVTLSSDAAVGNISRKGEAPPIMDDEGNPIEEEPTDDT